MRDGRSAAALPSLASLGMGAMGGPVVRNLLQAGYPVRACETKPERLAAGAALVQGGCGQEVAENGFSRRRGAGDVVV